MDAETSVREQNDDEWADILRVLCPELSNSRLQPIVNDFNNHRKTQPRD